MASKNKPNPLEGLQFISPTRNLASRDKTEYLSKGSNYEIDDQYYNHELKEWAVKVKEAPKTWWHSKDFVTAPTDKMTL